VLQARAPGSDHRLHHACAWRHVHRQDCPNITGSRGTQRDRLLPADWGNTADAPFSADLEVVALERQGLLRDISEAISRERINVTAGEYALARLARLHALHAAGDLGRCESSAVLRQC
jgi:(p)ppGpp synthase/HD superfamily hydrolase